MENSAAMSQDGFPQSVMTKLEDLNLEDRFLFSEVMEDKEAYQAAVSILLEDEIRLLEKPETEKEPAVPGPAGCVFAGAGDREF